MELEKLSKAELLALAAEKGVEVDEKATKAVIIGLINGKDKFDDVDFTAPLPPVEAPVERYEPKAIVKIGKRVLAVFTPSMYGRDVVDVTPHLPHGDKGKIIGERWRALAIKKARTLNVDVTFE